MLNKILNFLLRTHLGRTLLVVTLCGGTFLFGGCMCTDWMIHACSADCAPLNETVDNCGIQVFGNGYIGDCLFGPYGNCANCDLCHNPRQPHHGEYPKQDTDND